MALSDEYKIRILKNTQIFSTAEAGLLGQIADKLVEISLKKDETLFYKGDKGHAMYIIENGSVKVHDGEHIFDTLRENDVFGEYSLIDTEVRSATITGLEETKLLSLNKDSFYGLIHSDQDVLQGILKLMVTRLRTLDVIQEELAQKNRKIASQKEEISKKNAELVSLNDEKNQLISIVAHDIRNPLASASTFVSLLKSEIDLLSEEHAEYVIYLQRSLDRITDLVTRILDVKAIESRYMNIKPSRFSVRSEVNDLISQLESKALQKDIQIVRELDEFEATLDQGLFRQITENLVTNAIKFSPPSKSIHIRLTNSKDRLMFEVQDEGPGLTKEDKSKLFGRFRILSAKPTGGESSTGLGLSIVKKFTETMEGKVWCESKYGKGATFKIDLPMTLRIQQKPLV